MLTALVWLVWIAQLVAIFHYLRKDGFGDGFLDFLKRFWALLCSSRAVRILGSGLVAFFLIGLIGRGTESYGAIVQAVGSSSLQLSLLGIVVILKLIEALGLRLGGRDMVFGSAEFATPEHAAAHDLIGTTGVRLGFLRNPNRKERTKELQQGVAYPLHYKGNRHLVTIAPTQSGKGVSAIIPNLLTQRRSMVVIDPKGENAMISHKQRSAIGKSCVLDPWGITGLPSAQFNPLDLLQADSPSLIEDGMLVAEALITNKSEKDPFWDDQAKGLVFGTTLHVATAPEEAGRRHLGRVRDILCCTPEEFFDLGEAMARSTIPAVVNTASRLASLSEEVRAGVFSTAQANTLFLESPLLREHLEQSDFRFADLKGDDPLTVFLVLPVDYLPIHHRWLRLVIALGIADIVHTPRKPKQPVMFVLDEFANLGQLKLIEQAYSLMAGLGIQIHAIIQDLAQLEGLYDKSWSTFIANSGVIQVFNTRDWKTAEYVSKMLGSTTQTLRSTSYSNSHGPGGGSSSSSVNFGLTARPLVFPDELMRMDRDAQILFIENANPVLADKLRWYNDPELKTLGRNLREEPPVLAAPVPQQSPKSQPTPWAFAAPTLNYAPKKKDDAPKTDDSGAQGQPL